MAGDSPDWSSAQSNDLFSGVLPNRPFSVTIDVSRFNSVIVSLFNVAGVSPLIARYSIIDVNGNTIDVGFLSADTVNGTPSWSIPVAGAQFQIVGYGVNPANASIVGSTLHLPKRTLNDGYPGKSYFANIPNGTVGPARIQLLNQDDNDGMALANLSSYNGSCGYYTHNTGLAGITSLILEAGFIDSSGTRVFRALQTLTSGNDLVWVDGHPFGYVSLWARPVGTTTAIIGVTLQVLPGTPG